MPAHRAIPFAALAALALLALPAASHAQSAQRYSVQASGIFVGTFGEAYDGLKDGAGIEAHGATNHADPAAGQRILLPR